MSLNKGHFLLLQNEQNTEFQNFVSLLVVLVKFRGTIMSQLGIDKFYNMERSGLTGTSKLNI